MAKTAPAVTRKPAPKPVAEPAPKPVVAKAAPKTVAAKPKPAPKGAAKATAAKSGAAKAVGKAPRSLAAAKPANSPPAKSAPAKAPARKAKSDPAAGPITTPARRTARKKASPPLLERLVAAAVESLEGDKAEKVVVLDIATRSSFADRMIVATGLADRQIQAMATHVEEALEALGVRRIRTEASPDWVLLDAGDLILHLFKPEARETYALERMWGPDSPAGPEAPPPPEVKEGEGQEDGDEA